jgi:hypothetical protein
VASFTKTKRQAYVFSSGWNIWKCRRDNGRKKEEEEEEMEY